jgi:hypothetical protein
LSDLQGSLDLKSWVEEALKPIDDSYLAPGLHPEPGSGAQGSAAKPSTPTKKGPAEEASTWPSRTEELRSEFEMSFYQTQADAFAQQAATSAQQTIMTRSIALASDTLPARFKRAVVNLTSRVITLARQAHMASIDAHQSAYTTELSQLQNCLEQKPDASCPRYDVFKEDLPKVEQQFKTAEINAAAAAQYATFIGKLANPDPPIDALSHSLNFIVTAGAGISPNWNLVNWKGPGTAGTLASVSAIRTHTLNIALGSPNAPAEVTRVLDNEAFKQAVQSLNSP